MSEKSMRACGRVMKRFIFEPHQINQSAHSHPPISRSDRIRFLPSISKDVSKDCSKLYNILVLGVIDIVCSTGNNKKIGQLQPLSH